MKLIRRCLKQPELKIFFKVLNSIAFMDAQRPYTIDTLKRIDLLMAAKELSFNELMKDIGDYDVYVPLTISEKDYQNYIQCLEEDPSSFLNEEEDSNGLQESIS